MKFYALIEEYRVKEFIIDAKDETEAAEKLVSMYKEGQINMSDALPYCIYVAVEHNEADLDVPGWSEYALDTYNKDVPVEEVRR